MNEEGTGTHYIHNCTNLFTGFHELISFCDI